MIGDILQPTHLLFVLVIALIVLGPKRLPEVGRALGRGLRDFRHALSTDELHEQMLSTTNMQSTTPVAQEPTEATETPLASEPPSPTASAGDPPTQPAPASHTAVQELPDDPEHARTASAPAPNHTH